MLTQTYVIKKLWYCPDTGTFIRLNNNGTRPPAGTINSCGYVRIILNKKSYLAHRLAWLYTYGVFPTYEVDHINGVRADNRLSNLRDVTKLENSRNRTRANKNNRYGLLGVTPYRNRWMAQLAQGTGSRYLGLFDTPEEAAQAYVAAKQTPEGGYLANNR